MYGDKTGEELYNINRHPLNSYDVKSFLNVNHEFHSVQKWNKTEC